MKHNACTSAAADRMTSGKNAVAPRGLISYNQPDARWRADRRRRECHDSALRKDAGDHRGGAGAASTAVEKLEGFAPGAGGWCWWPWARRPRHGGGRQRLGDRISRGIVITKYGHAGSRCRASCCASGHPLVDDNSVSHRGGTGNGEGLRPEDRVLLLISGGGSALFENPRVPLRTAGYFGRC